jgi:hypothetical protein
LADDNATTAMANQDHPITFRFDNFCNETSPPIEGHFRKRRSIQPHSRKIGSDDPMTGDFEQRYDALPAPSTVPRAMNQYERGHFLESRLPTFRSLRLLID